LKKVKEMNSSLRLSSPYIKYCAWLADVGLLVIAAVSSSHFYLENWHVVLDFSSLYIQLIAAAAIILIFFEERIYRSWRVDNMWGVLGAISWVWLIVVLLLTLIIFFAKTTAHISRIWFSIWCCVCWFCFVIQRFMVYYVLHWLRRKGYNYKTLLLVGQGVISQRVIYAINSAAWSGIHVIGVVTPEELSDRLSSTGYAEPNEVWICLPISNEVVIHQVLSILRNSFSNIRLVPDISSFRLINHGVSYSLGMPMFDLSLSPVSGSLRILKAIEDLVLSMLILAFVSPLMIFIAVGIKMTSNGPVLFKQKRLGWNGAEINVYKFRTMRNGYDNDASIKQAQRNDDRVTRIGRFLRRTSLDELPQFFNVLQGRMSIVGPRPHALAHNEQFKELVPRYMLRHKVKPGITGWAQIHGYRGETDTLEKMESRVEYDLYYIENMSIWLDLRIIVMTIFKGFVHENAY
jgi:putative colanic acid biosynthesis UDP-glucose lipid carrier transferase